MPLRRAAGRFSPLLFLLLLGVWMCLSASLEPAELAAGVLVSGLAAYVFTPKIAGHFGRNKGGVRARLLPLLAFGLWFAVEAVVSGSKVAFYALHPHLTPTSVFVSVRTALRHPMAIMMLASAITLTPGTISVLHDPKSQELLIHLLTIRPEEETRDPGRLISRPERLLRRVWE